MWLLQNILRWKRTNKTFYLRLSTIELAGETFYVEATKLELAQGNEINSYIAPMGYPHVELSEDKDFKRLYHTKTDVHQLASICFCIVRDK
ncbi:hypothetical protein RFK57_00905 [Streptococcus suis]|uniref:hypothetical protein n=1 Tax=Streptococcus suis TaxID=1307 RepID=UPI002FC6EC59